MHGLMQDHGLLISCIIRHAAQNHGEREIVSRQADATLQRSNYAQVEHRSRHLAAALLSLGIGQGDRVATLVMNGFRHLECFDGISGMGAVLHTVNPRLFDDQIVCILNHARSRVLLFDPAFAPLIKRIAHQLTAIEVLIVLAGPAPTPLSGPGCLCYAELFEAASDDFQWPLLTSEPLHRCAIPSGRRVTRRECCIAIARQCSTHPLAPVEVLEFLRPRMAKWWLPDAGLTCQPPVSSDNPLPQSRRSVGAEPVVLPTNQC